MYNVYIYINNYLIKRINKNALLIAIKAYIFNMCDKTTSLIIIIVY
jgi:hypothetical protein